MMLNPRQIAMNTLGPPINSILVRAQTPLIPVVIITGVPSGGTLSVDKYKVCNYKHVIQIYRSIISQLCIK